MLLECRKKGMSINIVISSAGTATRTSSSGGAGELGKLKKQLADLYAKLRQVPQGSGDAKQKIAQAKLIESQIQLVNQQIQNLEKDKNSEETAASPQKKQQYRKTDAHRLLDRYA
jgi:polyhydroxyalkanoate synthesis regulator phasin